MTALIPVPTDLAFRLLDEVSRKRALADDESLLLEAIVTQGHQSQGIRFKWTPKLERALVRASLRKGALQAFADANGLTYKAAHEHLRKVRARDVEAKTRAKKGRS